MKNLFILELKRFYVILLTSIVVLFVFSLTNLKINNEVTYQNEQLFVEIVFLIVIALSTVIFIRDFYIDYQYLYAKRTISNFKIFFPKLFVIMFNGLFILLVGGLLLNVKAFIFQANDQLLYRILDIPKYTFIIVGKLWFEWMNPISFVVNIYIYVFLVMTIFLKFFQTTDLHPNKKILVNLIESSLPIILTHLSIRLLLHGFELMVPLLSLNTYNYHPIILSFKPILMINPLFIPTIIIYGILLYFDSKKISDYYVLLDYYDVTRNMHPNIVKEID